MSIELASIPLAAFAGIVGVLSPCVWPLVPVVMSSAMGEGGLRGAFLVALGLAFAFAMAGTLLTFLLVQTGTDPEFFRTISSVLLIAVGFALLVDSLGNRFAVWASRFTSRFAGAERDARSPWSAFGVGALLGLVWLPCVGPTLGAAIGLASVGRDLPLAFATMAAYGLGTAGVLLAAGLLSQKILTRLRPTLTTSAGFAKKGLGATLLILGALVVLGMDKRLEAWGLGWLPEWSLQI